MQKQDWLESPPSRRQAIFEQRHIIIKGLVSELKLDEDAFDLMGIPLNRLVVMRGQYIILLILLSEYVLTFTIDMSLRTANEPVNDVIVGPVEQFLREATSDKGRVLTMSELPFRWTDPEGLE